MGAMLVDIRNIRLTRSSNHALMIAGYVQLLIPLQWLSLLWLATKSWNNSGSISDKIGLKTFKFIIAVFYNLAMFRYSNFAISKHRRFLNI